MGKTGKYGISQELEDKINKHYDDLFKSSKYKLGFAHDAEPKQYKEIWNKAIEAMAAKIIDDCNREGPYNAIGGARRIRELKK